ncbi:hypothetical protein FCV20_18830, partial [Clostridium botulinum]|nr:hypothetical protein [Clostridium botulinum]NFF59575.1 hypothetical protein [Clostridium botulinum]
PTFKQSAGIVNRPESTISGNISGSSKLSAVNIVPSSALQHTTVDSLTPLTPDIIEGAKTIGGSEEKAEEISEELTEEDEKAVL